MAEETKTAPAPGTPEYNAHMIALAEGKVNVIDNDAPAPELEVAVDTAAKPVRPEWCPEKFWDSDKAEIRQEALAKSYGELERTRATPAAPAKPVTPPAADLKVAADAAVAAAAAKPEDAALKATADAATAAATAAAAEAAKAQATPAMNDVVAKATAEHTADGKISEESYKALEANGLSRQYVDSYVEGLQARAELVQSKVYGEAGGTEQYAHMTAWAKANLSAEQVQAYDVAVTSGKLDATLGAVRNLKASFDAANGTAPSGRIEANGGNGGIQPPHFKSSAEMTAAIADPRYAKDQAYRDEVSKKIDGADKAGVHLGFYS
jgi:hypothetical protein